MELIITLLVASPIILVIWLVASVVSAKNRLRELTERLEQVQARLRRLEQAQDTAQASAPAPEFKPANLPPLKTRAENFTADLASVLAEEPIATPVVPPPFPPPPLISPVAEAPLAEPPIIMPPPFILRQQPASFASAEPAAEPAYATTQNDPPPNSESSAPPEKASFEMRLGTFWLVRVGIVMLLTGLAFFANYAYHNIVGKLGPAGKISLLYVASGILLGAGAWWQRRAAKDSLKNYAQVLFAGGLAAVYFTTYAAHHIPPLRIIESALLDGTLLLLWAGVIAWIADWRKSEVMALFAVGLAFYSSVITRVGDFTLYSNLILTVAAVVFLVRNRWAKLSFAGLITSYVGYAFWRFLHTDGWRWAAPDERLQFGAMFLACYWLVFTVATFLSKSEKLSGANRSAFLTLNNGAFFALFLLTMLQVHTGGFWKFSLGYGLVLLALAGVAKKMLPEEPLSKNAYLTQGLLLVTLGFITKFAGFQLALVLGVESVVLFVLGSQRQSVVLKFFSFASAALATSWCVVSMEHFNSHGLLTGASLGALLIFNAYWAHRQTAGQSNAPLRAEPTWFTLLAFAAWLATTWFNTAEANLPLVLAVEAVALTASIYFLRVREITFLGQFFLILAQLAWLTYFLNHTPPWWNPLVLIAVTIGLSHWWQHQKRVTLSDATLTCYSAVFALAAVGVVIVWLHPLVQPPAWLTLTSLLAVAVTAYGVVTRAWPLAICGQIFLGISAWEFLAELLHDKPVWFVPLAPLAVLGMLSFATVAWFARKPESSAKVRDPLLQVALIYRWLALAMSLLWIGEYVPERQRVWAFMLAAVVVFVLALWRCSREALVAVAVYAVASLAALWVREDLQMDAYWANLLALLALFALQQILRRVADKLPLAENIHAAIIFIVGVSLWRMLSCWVTTSGIFLTMSWAGFALVVFALGMFLRERFHRWFGLGVLAAAVGRVVFVDVWKQETIFRVLTFMALGVALLVMGFVYNKYQDAIRKWL